MSSLGSSYITFDENIGENVVSHRIVSYGTVMTDLPQPSFEGFEFCGWYNNRMGEGSATTSILAHNTQETYYAKWVPTLSGNTGAVTINGNALSNYQLNLPSNKTLVLSDSLSAFKTLMLSKGAVTSSKSLKITVEDTSNKTISSGESSYTIKVENNNLIVTATDDAAMSGALDRLSQFVSTAYAKNKTLNFASGFEFTQNYIPDDSQYSYTWSDEFSSEDLDKSVWLNKANYKEPDVGGYQIGENNWLTGNPEEGNATSGRYNINARGIFVDNGSAVVRAEKVNSSDAAGNSHYFINRSMSTIGSVEYLYGCIEIKAKLPQHPAAPQIWIYSSQHAETSSEIDLHEGIGRVSGYENNQQIVSNIHAAYHLSSDSNNMWKTSLDSSQPLDSSSSNRIYLGSSKTNYDNAYHIYSVKWTPDEIVFALDGEVYYTYNLNNTTDLINNATTYDGNSPFAGLTAQQIKDCFSKQMYINIGNVMGTVAGNYGPVYTSGDPAQADLLVDYVRIYQSSGDEGSSFVNKPYTVTKIAEVEQNINAFITAQGIENRGSSTKTVTMSQTGITSDSLKINFGDTLPVNYFVGSKYIYDWTDGTNSVKTYKDTSKTYTPIYADKSMLDVKYKVASTSGGKGNLLFTTTVDSGWSNYSKAGFVYSETATNPTIGASGCVAKESTKVYQDGYLSNYTNLLNCSSAGYTAYSKYMYNFAINDVALSGRTNNIYVRSYVKLSDGRIVYGDVLTISSGTTLSSNISNTFDKYIVNRLGTGATLDNLCDYSGDGTTNIVDLISLKKIAAGKAQNGESYDVEANDLICVRKVLLGQDNSKIK